MTENIAEPLVINDIVDETLNNNTKNNKVFNNETNNEVNNNDLEEISRKERRLHICLWITLCFSIIILSGCIGMIIYLNL